MNPFYFGDSERPLFGVYHPASHAAAGSSGAKGVVLCYPVGGEYLRAHRAFRQLTNLLVRSGMHVLRFDYSGTGDASGDPLDATMARWSDDVATAVEELRESAGVDRVSLAGLRLGAVLAARGARALADRGLVDRVVMWDPVDRGEAFMASMETVPLGGGVAPTGAMTAEQAPDATSAFPPGSVGIGGFPYTPRLQQEIRAIDLAAEAPPGGAVVEILSSTSRPQFEALANRWTVAGVRTRYRFIPSEGDWGKGDRFGSALIPQAIIQGVVQALLQPEPAKEEAR
jgi:uncharacterized protein